MAEDLEKRVRDIVAEKLKVDPARVTREASFIDDLGADSLDVTDMILTLEKETGRAVFGSDADSVMTFGDVLERLSKNEAPAQPSENGFIRRAFANLHRRFCAK